MTSESDAAPRAVTVDLWYTLLHLEPPEQERYLHQQEERAARLIESWPALPIPDGAPAPLDPRTAFRTEFRAAALAAWEGRSVAPTTQIARAAKLAGHEARPEEFAVSLGELVEGMEFRPAPGAVGFLQELRSKGYRLGLVSNTVGEPGRYLQRVCDRLGLGRFLEVWAWSDELPWTKPSPQIFHWCLSRLGVDPASAVHVGDGASDVGGAIAAGMRGAVLYEGLSDYPVEYKRMFAPPLDSVARPSARASRMSDIPGIVDQIFAGVPVRTPRSRKSSG